MTESRRSVSAGFVDPRNDLRYEVIISRQEAWRLSVRRLSDGRQIADVLLKSRGDVGKALELLYL